MKKIIIAVIVVILVAGGGFFAYNWYTVSQTLNELVFEQQHIASYLQDNQAYAPQPAPNWDSFNNAINSRDTASAAQILQDAFQQYVVPTDKAMYDAYTKLNQEYHTKTGNDTEDLVSVPICPMRYSYFENTDLLTGCFPINSGLVEQAQQRLAEL
ncbi:hypothetical protein [Culicoidibacter larvae]|uniref:Uncharacterized protein n=1 Tax=Culicoidibacter larvae TaxID=2579976 RepID=A0A5R8QF72_9FIRM|nr:hypothetical protein [Culicoidibacter larvae]TLG76689.1 hypothetical protein FEZ08_03485 [Culicoidibacter larvae]